MMSSKLRKPFDEESIQCAKLIYLSGPALYNYLMVQKETKIYDLLSVLFKNPGNPFSKENVVIEE